MSNDNHKNINHSIFYFQTLQKYETTFIINFAGVITCKTNYSNAVVSVFTDNYTDSFACVFASKTKHTAAFCPEKASAIS